MKNTILLMMAVLLFQSCLSVESKLSESSDESETARRARSVLVSQDLSAIDTLALQSQIQSDPDVMLLNHIVEVGDSSILLMSPEDRDYIGIPAEKYERMLVYVDSLNAVAGRVDADNI